MSLHYDNIVTATKKTIVAETRNKFAARRAFLVQIIADANAEMARLDNERLSHFLARIQAAGELRDLDHALSRFEQDAPR